MTAVVARSSGSGSSFRVFASVSRLHIIAIAALGTFTFGWLFTGKYPWALSAVCALDWFLVNLLNRVVDLPEDNANQIAGTDFVARHASTIRTGGFFALFASFVAIHLAIPAITPYRVGYHALGLAYNWPLLPGHARIKQLYFWKNAASATGFMLTCFAYPLAAASHDAIPLAHGITIATILVTALFFFLFELSYEVIYDLRDARGDAEANVRTYPVVHGERGAVRIIDALCVASASALVIGFAAHVVPWRIAVMAVAPSVQVVVYRRWLRRGITSADCVGLTWFGAGLLVAYHLWVALRLPGVGMD
jgi:4-hydroxybenzoate polyprenyltransferase